MRLSIQGRLTALYAGALLVALTLCGLGLYAALVRLEISSIDHDLQNAASTTTFSMKAEEDEGLDLRAAAVDTIGELRVAGITFVIYDAAGHLLAARWESLAPAAASLREGVTTLKSSGGEWRQLVTRASHQHTDYLVLNALPLEPVRRHTELLPAAFLAILPVTILIAGGGGWLMARSTLRPVIESQRRFMADASHELRTPVSVIRSAADITLSRPQRSAAEYQDSVGIIAEQANRLSRLVEDLFLLARADAHGRPLATTRFYLDDVLAECVRAVDMLGRPRDVSVAISSDEDIEIVADEDLIRRMLMNLLENAVRYTQPGTRVDVELRREDRHIRVAVHDRGPGVPNEARERIFERFVRLEPGQPGGAGLGLAIARWVAEAHGGALVLAESSSSGSVFVVRLPLPVPI